MHGSRQWVALSGVGLCLWVGQARAACSKDIECKGDRICVDGACMAPPPAEPHTTQAPAPPRASNTPQQPLTYRHRNRGLMISGIVLTSAGAATLIATIVFGALASSCNAELDSQYPSHVLPLSAYDQAQRCDRYSNAAGILLIATVPLVAAGLPLLLVGGKKVPVYAQSARVGPWLTRDSRGFSLRLSF